MQSTTQKSKKASGRPSKKRKLEKDEDILEREVDEGYGEISEGEYLESLRKKEVAHRRENLRKLDERAISVSCPDDGCTPLCC